MIALAVAGNGAGMCIKRNGLTDQRTEDPHFTRPPATSKNFQVTSPRILGLVLNRGLESGFW